MELHARIHEEDDGSLWAEVKELPGCFASGATMSELTEALLEAVGLWLEDGSSAVRVSDSPARIQARVEEMTLVTG
jgi:predicted RNase H-like HicB family nuclease